MSGNRFTGLIYFTLTSFIFRVYHSLRYTNKNNLNYFHYLKQRKLNNDANISNNNKKVNILNSVNNDNNVQTNDILSMNCDGCNNKSIENELKPNDMLNSVKHYDRHVILFTPTFEWSPSIEDYQEFPFSIIKSLDEIQQSTKMKLTSDNTNTNSIDNISNKKKLKIKITALHEPSLSTSTSNDKDTCQILIYPENLLFHVRRNQIDAFAKLVNQPIILTTNDNTTNTIESTLIHNYNIDLINEFQYTIPTWKKLILVCIHQSRDKRCGRAGPQVITELQKQCELAQLTGD